MRRLRFFRHPCGTPFGNHLIKAVVYPPCLRLYDGFEFSACRALAEVHAAKHGNGRARTARHLRFEGNAVYVVRHVFVARGGYGGTFEQREEYLHHFFQHDAALFLIRVVHCLFRLFEFQQGILVMIRPCHAFYKAQPLRGAVARARIARAQRFKPACALVCEAHRPAALFGRSACRIYKFVSGGDYASVLHFPDVHLVKRHAFAEQFTHAVKRFFVLFSDHYPIHKRYSVLSFAKMAFMSATLLASASRLSQNALPPSNSYFHAARM